MAGGAGLPAARTPLIGREAEQAAVAALLDRSRLVTVTGAGGSGKTRLALAVAASAAPAQRHGVHLVDLSPLPSGGDATAVRTAVGRALGLSDEGVRDPLPFLHARQVLLVVDNAEHVIDGAAAVVDELLAGAPEVRVLATSREVLGVPGEATFVLPPLAVPPEGTDVGLRAYAATALFLERAAGRRPDVEPSPDDARAIAEVCRSLDGIPLAIELAAARTRVLSPRQIADGLDRRFELLTGGPRTALPRHQTLRASVEWSHDLLHEAERVALRRLAVFAGPFDLDAAVAVVAAPPIEAGDVLDLVSSLVDKSIVVVAPAGDALRYRLLDTIRGYGLERLRDADEEDDVRRRHRDHHLAVAEAARRDLWGPAGIDAFERLAQARSDHEQAFRWSVVHAPDEAAAVVRAAAVFADVDSFEWIGAPLLWFAAAAPWVAAAPAEARLALLVAWAAQVLKTQVPPDPQLTAQTATTLDELGVDVGATARAVVAGVALGVLSGDDAVDRARSAAEAARLVGDAEGEMLARIVAWRAARAAGRADAVDLAHEVGAAARRGGPLLQAAALASYSAYLHSAPAALAAADRVLAAGVERLPAVHRHAQRDRAFALEALGRHEEAAVLADETFVGFVENGDGNCAGWMLEVRSHQAEAVDDLDGALDLMHRACDLVRPTPLWDAFSPLLLARLVGLHLVRDDVAAATAARAAIDDVPPERRGPFHAPALAIAGALVALVTDDEGALDRAHEALDATVDGGFPGIGTALVLVACASARRGRDPEAAARLLGAGETADARTGSRAAWRIVDELRLDAVRRLAADAGLERIEAARREGAAVATPDAVAAARRGRGSRRRPASGWESLTPTEAMVVDLVAEGLANAVVAQRLFMSVRTVTTHLTHVYAKLGLSTRSELAVAAARRRDHK